MLGMGEPTKQNGEERRARLGVKPSSAAVPEENVQQEKMTNVSQADPGPPRRCRRDSQQQWCDLSLGNGRIYSPRIGSVLRSWLMSRDRHCLDDRDIRPPRKKTVAVKRKQCLAQKGFTCTEELFDEQPSDDRRD